MRCFVCRQDFIITETLDEFLKKKVIFDTEMCKKIDYEFTLGEDFLWEKLLRHEALLLQPNKKPNLCVAGKCDAIICNYCRNKTKDISYWHNRCIICKNTSQQIPNQSLGIVLKK